MKFLLIVASPAKLEAAPKAHKGAIQYHATIGRRDIEFLTDFINGLAGKFFQGENLCMCRLQMLQTVFEDFNKLVVVQRLVRIAPVLWWVYPLATGIKQFVDTAIACRIRHYVDVINGCFARLFTNEINDFVLEDTGEPGLFGGSTGIAGACLKRSQQGFLCHVFRMRGVVQPPERIAKQGIAIFL